MAENRDVAIGDLAYQRPVQGIAHQFETYSGFWKFLDIQDGHKGKVTLADSDVLSDQHTQLNCDIPTEEPDITISGREVEMQDIELKLVVPRCSTKAKWLNYQLKKGANAKGEQNVFLEDLADILVGQSKKSTIGNVMNGLRWMAFDDTTIGRVPIPVITDGASAYAAVKTMISSSPQSVKNTIYDTFEESKAIVFVATEVLEFLHDYIEENDGGNVSYGKDTTTVFVKGVEVTGFSDLGLDEMIITPISNLKVFIDDENDFARVRVVAKDEISTDIILLRYALGSGYKSSKRISVSDGFPEERV